MSSLQVLHDYLLRASSSAIESDEPAAPAAEDKFVLSECALHIAPVPQPGATLVLQPEPPAAAELPPSTVSNSSEVLVSEMRRLVADMISLPGLFSTFQGIHVACAYIHICHSMDVSFSLCMLFATVHAFRVVRLQNIGVPMPSCAMSVAHDTAAVAIAGTEFASTHHQRRGIADHKSIGIHAVPQSLDIGV